MKGFLRKLACMWPAWVSALVITGIVAAQQGPEIPGFVQRPLSDKGKSPGLSYFFSDPSVGRDGELGILLVEGETSVGILKIYDGSAKAWAAAGRATIGTLNAIPKFTANDLADSLLSESGGDIVLASGGFVFPAAAIAAPTFAVSGDLNTGWTSAGADTMSIVTGGVETRFTTTGIVVNSNYALEGYPTGRNVLRSILLRVQPGATPGTNINVSDMSGVTAGLDFNVPTITDGTNIAKSGTSGSFSLNAAGTIITMNITEDVIGILGPAMRIHDINTSSQAELYLIQSRQVSNNLDLSLIRRGTSGTVDWTTVMDAGDMADIYISFITSS